MILLVNYFMKFIPYSFKSLDKYRKIIWSSSLIKISLDNLLLWKVKKIKNNEKKYNYIANQY